MSTGLLLIPLNPHLKATKAPLAQIAEMIPPQKIYVFLGNHDFYGGDLRDEHILREWAEGIGAHYVQKASIELDGVRFLCCTLWTDFNLTGDPEGAMKFSKRAMNDYRRIHDHGPFLQPARVVELHRDHLAWLTEEIRKPFEGRTVVVTHHGPSPATAGEIDELTPSFNSEP